MDALRTLETIIITRHAALVAWLIEQGHVPPDVTITPHATAEQIRGHRVVGPLPLHLAALASSIVHVPLDVPAEMRGRELTIEEIRQHAGVPQEFIVRPAADAVYVEADGGDLSFRSDAAADGRPSVRVLLIDTVVRT